MIRKKKMRDAIDERFLTQPLDVVDVDDGVGGAIVDDLRKEKKVSRERWKKEELVIAVQSEI